MVNTRAWVVVLLGWAFVQAPAALADSQPAPAPVPTAPAGTSAAKDAASPAAPAGAPAAKDAAPAPAAGSAPQTSDEAFDVRVKSLEEQVNDLKEKIFRTKARLLLLQETVVGGDIVSGARAVIFHENEMGASFVLESAAYALDGSPVFTKVDVNGDLAGKPEIEIFSGRIVPGNHQLAIKLQYRGHGFGPISYLDGYHFKVTSNYTFNAEAGKVTTVKAIGYEKGGPFAELKDKPDIRYETGVSKESAVARAGPPAAGSPAPAPGTQGQ